MAIDVLGKSKCALQGKATQSHPQAVIERPVEVPTSMQECGENVELSMDVLHVNRVPFPATISKHIHCVTINPLDDMKTPTLESAIKRPFRTCGIRGFDTTVTHEDIQFKAIRDRNSLGAKQEHVPEIERMI